jgi:lysyl-tRNA synthetase class 2
VRAAGHALREGADFEDAFFHVMTARAEPAIGRERPVVVARWPRQMAMLARLCDDDVRFAERFELYAGGLELANAYLELTDPNEQRARFEADNLARVALNKAPLPIDELFLRDLATMPAAAGIALGFDRLLMLLTDAKTIDEVVVVQWR